MNTHESWLLPAGIEELLPDDASKLESIRQQLLDLFTGWGYKLVVPPLIEYLDSLLIHANQDLNLKTFKLTDQMSGRTMGIRADITPQVARIDAHRLKNEGPTRLCYAGTVLKTLPETLGGTRSPLQIGAELYGHSGLASDLEIVELMLHSVESIGIRDAVLDIGHVGIFKSLVKQAELNSSQRRQIFSILQRKSPEELKSYCESLNIDQRLATGFQLLGKLHGGTDILERAKQELAPIHPDIATYLDYVVTFAEQIKTKLNGTRLHFDLAELPGYEYENGLLFTLYLSGETQPIARGGRYDGIGRHFGRARPATGFSADLTLLARHYTFSNYSAKNYIIFAPLTIDEDVVNSARSNGHTVIRQLDKSDRRYLASECTHEFVLNQDQWEIQEFKQ